MKHLPFLLVFLLIISCGKESSPEIDLVESQNDVTLKDGRLVFTSDEDFQELLNDIELLKEAIPAGFRSYQDIYEQVKLLTDEEYEQYVTTNEYKQYFNTVVQDDGLRFAEPITNWEALRLAMNSDLEYQVGDDIVKYSGDKIYSIKASEFDLSSFEEKASSELIHDNSTQRASNLDFCRVYFLRTGGAWRRQMQGRLRYERFWASNRQEYLYKFWGETRAMKKTTIGWWRLTGDYDDLYVGGNITTTLDGSSNSHTVSGSCGSCADVVTAQIAGDWISSANLTHSLQCGGDCANEGVNGVVTCSTSD